MAWTPPTSFNWGKWSNSSSSSNSFNECNFSWSIKDSCVRPRSSSLLLLDWPAPAPTNIIKGKKKQFGYGEWRGRIHGKNPEEQHDGKRAFKFRLWLQAVSYFDQKWESGWNTRVTRYSKYTRPAWRVSFACCLILLRDWRLLSVLFCLVRARNNPRPVVRDK